MINLTFLGTSQAVPTAKRNHTAILLRYENEMILVDCGEGTQRQFRIANMNPCKLTKILITHWHGDHVLGLPGLLQTLALNGYNKTLHIYGPKGTKKFLSMLLEIFIFVQNIKIEIHEIFKDGIFLDETKFKLEAFNLEHGIPCLAYSFIEKEKIKIKIEKIKHLKLDGKLIGEIQKGKDIMHEGKKIKSKDYTYIQKGKKVSFILDTRLCKNCFYAANESDLLIAESTYLAELEKKAFEYKHLTSEQAAEIAKKAKVKKLILTHVSQRYEKDTQEILKEAKRIFQDIEMAKDFMSVEL